MFANNYKLSHSIIKLNKINTVRQKMMGMLMPFVGLNNLTLCEGRKYFLSFNMSNTSNTVSTNLTIEILKKQFEPIYI